MCEDMMNTNQGEFVKIKTHYARIVVGGTAEKPCYSIEWYDPLKKEYNLGYSSYYIGYVFNWLSEYFEIVDKDINVLTNADRIRAMSDEELARWMCGGSVSTESACNYCDKNNGEFCNGEKCRGKTDTEIIMEWLKQPAE